MSFFLPREKKFFDLFKQQTAKMMEAGSLLKQQAYDFENREAIAKKLKEVEKEADNIARQIFLALHKTFIPPLDHEDIKSLTEGIDEVIDQIEKLANRFVILGIELLPPEVLKFIDIIEGATWQINEGVLEISKKRMRVEKVTFCCQEISDNLEEKGDEIHRNALRDLFKEEKNPVEIIKWFEIYEILEKAIDQCKKVTYTLDTIALKRA